MTKEKNERLNHETYFYDPIHSLVNNGYGQIPIAQGTISEQIETQNKHLEFSLNNGGMMPLNEEDSISFQEIKVNIEKLEAYIETGNKSVLGENTYVNPSLTDFQEANVQLYNLPQNKNLEKFIEEKQKSQKVSSFSMSSIKKMDQELSKKNNKQTLNRSNDKER